jgi:polyhydroxybutyrate depolymerase
MLRRKYYSFLLLFIVSCGGGGSSSNNDAEPTPAPPVSEPAETCVSYSANTERCSLTHKGLDRYYLIYTPTTITNNDEAPILFALHGYGSSAETHKSYTMHEPFANTNKTIVVYAQGYKLETAFTSSSSHWNVGAWTIGSTVDDIDFIDTIIDLIDDKASH